MRSLRTCLDRLARALWSMYAAAHGAHVGVRRRREFVCSAASQFEAGHWKHTGQTKHASAYFMNSACGDTWLEWVRCSCMSGITQTTCPIYCRWSPRTILHMRAYARTRWSTGAAILARSVHPAHAQKEASALCVAFDCSICTLIKHVGVLHYGLVLDDMCSA